MPAISDNKMPQNKKLQEKPAAKAISYTSRPVHIKKPKPFQSFSSFGLAMPFQPSMWDDKMIENIMNTSLEQVKKKLEESCRPENSEKILARLRHLFKQLNYHTHRKSVVLMLSPDKEKIIYLDYPVKLSTWFGKDFSLQDISLNIEKEPGFFFLTLAGRYIRLFEYKEANLIKVAIQNIERNGPLPDLAGELTSKAASLLKSLNKRMVKPVFISYDMMKAEPLHHQGPLPGALFNDDKLRAEEQEVEEKVMALANAISKDWKRWHNKYISDLLLFADKTKGLIPDIEAVLKALNKNSDGLLLLHKNIITQAQDRLKSKIDFSTYESLKQQVEKFLARGNCVEMANNILLKKMGGIVLIKAKQAGMNEDIYLPRRTGKDFSIY
jgi:hypothetical protein